MKQITVRVEEETYNDIVSLAEEAQHSVDKTARNLIKMAIKERKRKRNGKKDNT
jgi:hypothetical protein